MDMDSNILYAAVGVVINLLFGGVIWFMKSGYNDLREQLKDHRIDIDKLKESTVKREDFREFKDELWVRLDKLESHWLEKINELRK